MKDLNTFELSKVDGGCFAFDTGWFLGNLVTGGFYGPANIAESAVEYGVHYGSEHDH